MLWLMSQLPCCLRILCSGCLELLLSNRILLLCQTEGFLIGRASLAAVDKAMKGESWNLSFVFLHVYRIAYFDSTTQLCVLPQ